jgi:hypothetical protein
MIEEFLKGIIYGFLGIWIFALIYCLIRFFMTYKIKLERRM